MSAHNHDEVFIRQTVVGRRLQRKANAAKDERIKNALLKADISGLSKSEAKAKLNNIVNEILND